MRTVIFTRRKFMGYARRRFPIISWASGYKRLWFLEDLMAGMTVGLTAIPQGIAYGIVAGLDAEYGLYSAFMSSFVYIFFGSCANITIGPTAIMALMVQPLVAKYGADVAVLICFLKGLIITLLGIFHLGFLLDFISLPVIAGFTSGAAITIASSQFKPILGIPGSSSSFVDSIVSVFTNLDQIGWWDTLLGFGTVAFLVLLKNFSGNRTGSMMQKMMWMICLGRNAIVVIFGTALAYAFSANGLEPFRLTGSLGQGLPALSFPPFSTKFNNETFTFFDLTTGMGQTLVTLPIISTIEHMAIAKAFAMGKSFDATQEMLALGLCNVFGSFVRSMPVTGSFTRTAVNHASGVRTPMGGLFTGILVLMAVGLLTEAFRFIPRATLAGVIVCAMYYMLDFQTCVLLWKAKKVDLAVLVATFVSCVFLGVELGIFIGILLNLIPLFYYSARPSVQMRIEQIEGRKYVQVIPEEAISFPAAEHIRNKIMKLSEQKSSGIIFNGKNLKRIDATVAKNIKLLAKDLKVREQEITFVNCPENVETVIGSVAPELALRFVRTDPRGFPV
ncbi:sodium-independent sulfate anion transporter-like isoform X1 [Athalia rosae]|uniref:sodium-independent sulfate anion transporter-like isoform X1 n=1 Tax=Athalia rosae TaxID=37344 RepID=UPI0020339AB1|nr:sodium-independent sulfate anion transporter-like isoform X1 [Athalia rosae]